MTQFDDNYFGKVTRLGAAIALSAAVALVAVAPAQAQSGRYDSNDQDRRYDARDDRNNGQDRDYYRGRAPSSSDFRRSALVRGYEVGYERGVEARRQRNRSDYRRDDAYRQANDGYDTRYNDRTNNQRTYQSQFRQGFTRGYSDGFNGRQRSRAYYNGNAGNYNNGNYNNGNYNNGNYNNGNAGSYVDNRRGDKDPQEVAEAAAQNGYRAGFERGQSDAARDKGRANPNPQGHGAYQFGLDGWSEEWGSGQTYQQYYRQYFIQGHTDAYQQRGNNYRYRRN